MFSKLRLSFSIFVLSISILHTSAQTGQWTTINSSNSPTARHECSYVQAGSKFYLVGGRGTKPVQAYDPIANSWTTHANPPMQLHHFQAIQYNNKIYVIGAFTGNCCHETPVANIYIYDPANHSWTAGPEIPAARRRGAAGCVVYNNKFYLVCGITDGHSSGWVSWLDVYDPQANTWTQLADAPRPRDHFHATQVNGKIYAIGGRRTGLNGNLFAHTTPEVDVYDIASNSWTTLPSSKNIPTQRAACATAILGNEILVIGGESAQVAHAQTEAFNIATQTWRSVASLNQSRHATSAIFHNNQVYIACGAGTRGGSMELNSQEVFSFSTVNQPDCNGVLSGTAFYDDCGICSGGNTGHVANSDKDSCGVCFGNGSSCVPGACQPLEVVSFTLMKEGTAGEIGLLTNGMTINLATIGNFSIRANTCNGQNVGSVRFILNGSILRTETDPPYAINGDTPAGNYKAWNPTTGAKTLTGVPYSGAGGTGTQGISETVNFTVINEPVGTPDCNGVAGGSALIDDCGVCSGGNTGHVANSDKDACGVCFGNGSSCANADCNGTPNGTAAVDDCGVCAGGTTGIIPNSAKDECGVCNGNNSAKDCNGVCFGTASVDNCGVCSGGNTGITPNSSCPQSCVPNEVVSFTLMKTGTAGEIGPLTNGMTINLATIGNFSIRANTCNGQNVGSVRFILNGSILRTETDPPYSINGDTPAGNYKAWNPTTGTKTLTAVPYSGPGGTGTQGVSETVTFTVVNQAGGTPDCNGVPGGTAIVDDCGVCSGGNTGHVANSDKDVCGVCFGNGSSCATPDCNGVAGGSAFIDDCGVCSGGNTGHVANSDKDACGVCFGNGSSCGGSCQPLEVISFTLMHEGTAGEIGTLANGMVINLATMPDFSVRANTCNNQEVGSVRFILNGKILRTESSFPYSINGDTPAGNYKSWNPAPGSYTLTGTPYSGSSGSGSQGISETVNFTVVSGSAKTSESNIQDEVQQQKLKLFPNPNNGRFTIEMEIPEPSDVQIKIYNRLGQVIYTDEKFQFSGEMEESILLEKQPAGVYFLQLIAGEKIFNQRILTGN